MGLLDSLVKVTISISTGAESGDSYSNILIAGPASESNRFTSESGVIVVTSLDEVITAGYLATEEVYKAASVAFTNGASKLYLAAYESESSVTASLTSMLSTNGWYGLYVVGVDSVGYSNIAMWAEANKKLFGYTADVGSVIGNPVSEDYYYAFGVATKDSTANKHIALAMMAKAFSYQSGSETWAYKTLSGMTADNYTTAEIASLQEERLNYYLECAGKDITLDGKTASGEWIDVVRFRDYLLNDMQTRIYSLFTKNAKVPYNDAGIALIQNQMIAALKNGQSVGGISDTEFDSDGEEIPGYTTSVPLSADVSDGNKATRILSGCSFTARLSNAIHLVEISGTLSE